MPSPSHSRNPVLPADSDPAEVARLVEERGGDLSPSTLLATKSRAHFSEEVAIAIETAGCRIDPLAQERLTDHLRAECLAHLHQHPPGEVCDNVPAGLVAELTEQPRGREVLKEDRPGVVVEEFGGKSVVRWNDGSVTWEDTGDLAADADDDRLDARCGPDDFQDDADALASAGHGSDEDYGSAGGDE
jgi:hypothetical protein